VDAENLFEYITDNSLRMEVYNDFKRKNYSAGGGIKGNYFTGELSFLNW
jgi:hypothetical protein